MTTIKSYTNLEQSKKLAEILPIESADMGWNVFVDDTTRILPINDWDLVKDGSGSVKFYHAWSLAALLSVLPRDEHKDIDLCCGGYKGDKYIPEWFSSYEQQRPTIIEICHADNPVDACVALIEKLHELKRL